MKETDLNKPNIVLIYADDIGYGDLECYGATGIATPNVNRLTEEGIKFSSAYASSATCTPSRYTMLTGHYAWRKKGTGVLRGDAKMIIDTDQLTLPALLQRAGYTTGVIGKWHLGLGDGKDKINWNKDIKPGPNEIGFNYSFLLPATGDRVPCVYLENGRVVNLDPEDPITVRYHNPIPDQPTGKTHRDTLKMDWSHGHNCTIVNGISRIGFMSGGSAALWKDEDMADEFVNKAVAFIENNRKQPFFLYFSTHDIHVPRVPHPRFVGKTTMGPRGDAVVQFDWCVGEILETLDRLDLADNTMVILTSDNGPVLDDGYKDAAAEKVGDHKPAGPFRGGKYSAFEAGTREPFIVRWPARIKPGVSDAKISQVDLMSSFAALTGQELKGTEAPDSLNMLDVLLGKDLAGRDYIIEQSPATMSVIQGHWKYIKPSNARKIAGPTGIETGCDPNPQLYNMKDDMGETKNLADVHPEKAEKLSALLEKVKSVDRTRP